MKKISKPTQEQKILEYLQRHDTITGLEALREFGCMRLPARIGVLEDRGYRFTKVPVIVENRGGERIRVTAYGLRKEGE